LAESYEYSSFGVLTVKNASGNAIPASELASQAKNLITFTAREYIPEIGKYYYRARMYDPALGRFMQRDPIGYAGGQNLYTYCDNNPVNRIDPMGLLEACPEFNLYEFNPDEDDKGVKLDLDLSLYLYFLKTVFPEYSELKDVAYNYSLSKESYLDWQSIAMKLFKQVRKPVEQLDEKLLSATSLYNPLTWVGGLIGGADYSMALLTEGMIYSGTVPYASVSSSGESTYGAKVYQQYKNIQAGVFIPLDSLENAKITADYYYSGKVRVSAEVSKDDVKLYFRYSY